MGKGRSPFANPTGHFWVAVNVAQRVECPAFVADKEFGTSDRFKQSIEIT
jgi:hypothetical protein